MKFATELKIWRGPRTQAEAAGLLGVPQRAPKLSALRARMHLTPALSLPIRIGTERGEKNQSRRQPAGNRRGR